jgi:hypothetical protein
MPNSSHPETATRYWVVGGKYATMDFECLVQGTERVFGPFGCVDDAKSMWRSVTEKTRCQATVRYTIAAEQSRIPRAS